MRETSRTGVVSMSELVVGATKEHPVRSARHIVSKHPLVSASQGEPSSKKTKKGYEAEASAWLSLLVLRSRRRKRRKRKQLQHFILEACVVGAL